MLYSVTRVRTKRDNFARAETLTLLALGVVLVAVAVLRQDFIGDGVRHVQPAMASSHPPIGVPRWLLFPALAWALIHPLVWAGLISNVESAIGVLLSASVVAGIVYLIAIRVWLRAAGYNPARRTAALVLAAATMPFFVLYTDIAEVQIAAALIVLALAVTRSRTADGTLSDAAVLVLLVVIAAGTLVYQGLIVAIAFVPLVVPPEKIHQKRILIGGVLILSLIPLTMIVARTMSGERTRLAVEMTLAGEANADARSSMGRATPLKWAAALFAGPPQAIIRLTNFQGLPLVARDLQSGATRLAAIGDIARLAAGLLMFWVIVFLVVRTRDWRLALALAAVVALPTIRNSQYTYHKFYVFWPALMALASTKAPAKLVVSAAAIVLVLNASLLARDVAAGRRFHSEMETLYRSADPATCFFTSGWGAPFPYLWPGSTAAIISDLWRPSTDQAAPQPLTASVRHCFCDASRVWTDTSSDEAQNVDRLLSQFKYRGAPVVDLLYTPADGFPANAHSPRIFIYTAARQADLCRRLPN
jgi:hypothetical protein